jgi:AcrR family transcriptional regulator
LEQAMRVFWRMGYEGASVAELTKAMGINAPSLYAAFGSKESLFRAALDHYDIRRQQCLDSVLSAPTAHKAAERLLYGVADLVTDPDEPPGCLLLQGGLSCGMADIPKELARRRAALEQALEQRLRRAQDEGDLARDADPAALARYLGVVCNGLAVQAAAGAGRAALREVARMALQAWPGLA